MSKQVQHELFGECVELTTNTMQALIAPHMGMSLVDFTINGEQLLDQSRRDVFLSCRKGLGPLILPHFNQEGEVPKADVSGLPHVKALNDMGVNHPFQHGVGRYAAWQVEAGDNYVKGKIRGSDKLNGCTLKEMAGFDFTAEVTYILGGYRLLVGFDVQGEKPVTSGIHFYYDLKNADTAKAVLQVQGDEDFLTLNLKDDLDNVYLPKKEGHNIVRYVLDTDTYELETFVKVNGDPSETFDSVTVYSPKGATFACLEPLFSVPDKPNAKTHVKGAIGLVPRKK
jgi:galactose mutarotase-like enzyme